MPLTQTNPQTAQTNYQLFSGKGKGRFQDNQRIKALESMVAALKQQLATLQQDMEDIKNKQNAPEDGLPHSDLDIGASTSKKPNKPEEISIRPCNLQAFSAEELANLSEQSESLVQSDRSTTELQSLQFDQRLLSLGIKSVNLIE